ncbi:multidrug efflux SMR transporter [Paenibacillus mesophilus]|uniref:DMT family transporter n=1 Tax=Paenibacillus mesophilus TaxID=2582849 RepID=UPI00110F5E1A|nr:multidrug efflux SMR transporter [Paenibacillus mesophilus]TMV52127.1 multidrug efflux SMR transporter [Paenibacillus mesophilus]
MNRNWMLVFVAGLFEIAWVSGLKHAYDTLTWIGTIVAILISMDLLIRASKRLPIGTTYAVFTGIGTAGTVVMEMVVFGEPFKIGKLLLIMLLLAGVVGLKTITKEHGSKEVQ